MRRMILPERVLGRPGAHCSQSGEAIGPISLRTPAHQFHAQVVARLGAGDQGDIGVDALALDVVRRADHGGLRHLIVRHQRALDLGGAHAVAGDVDHVVDPAGDPVIAVGVAPAAVAGEILALVGGEIGLHEAVVVAVDRAHLAGPAVGDAQVALAGAVEHLAVGVDDLGPDAEEGPGRRAGLEPGRAGQRRDQDAAGFGLPPSVDDRGSGRRRRHGNTIPRLPG